MPKPAAIAPLGQASPYVKMCLIAGSGFGKTIFSATAPRALHLVSDKEGTESALGMGLGKGNEEWQITHWDKGDNSLDAAYEYMRDEGCNEYDWLIHDTVASENKLAMKSALEKAKAVKEGRQDPLVPDKPQYLTSQYHFMDMVVKFHDLPINQIWLAQPRFIELSDEDDNLITKITADIQNDGIAQQFLALMKLIGSGAMKNVDGKTVRRMYFTGRGSHQGKDRYSALGAYKDDLTVPKMMELIEAKRSGRARPTAKKTTATRRRRTA